MTDPNKEEPMAKTLSLRQYAERERAIAAADGRGARAMAGSADMPKLHRRRLTEYTEMERRIAAADDAARARRRHDRIHGAGCLYVVEFASGVVKVGRSVDVVARLKQHATTAKLLGSGLSRSWSSARHPDFAGTERELIRFCRREFVHGAPPRGEYFTGLDFARVRDFAHLLISTHLAEGNEKWVAAGGESGIAVRFADTIRRRRAYLDALLGAAHGDAATTWGEATRLLAAQLADEATA